MYRGKISSDLEEMQKLQQMFKWMPGKDSIRPDAETLARKQKFNEMVKSCYFSEADYLYETVFRIPAERDAADGLKRVDRELVTKQKRVFDRNQFGYALPDETRHFIMWYTFGPPELNDEHINEHIVQDISSRVGHDRFEFAWYENPKMTVPDIYHVQVRQIKSRPYLTKPIFVSQVFWITHPDVQCPEL